MESSSIEENTESSLSSDDHILLSNEEAQKSKDVITEFAEAYSADLAAERFGVSRNTVRLWLKQRKVVPPPKPVYNSPGQGRKITYSRELDMKIAEHIRGLLAKGERVTVQEVCTYARSLIQMENPDFSASTGWAQRFLARNGIDLSAQVRKLIPTARHAHLPSSAIPDNRGRPLSYSAETDNLIADWVRNRTDRGEVITNSELRKYARDIISKQNPNFTGSASWAQNFLLRHRLSLHPNPIFFPSSSVEKAAKSDIIAITQPSTDTTSSVPSLQLISSQVVCEGQSQGISVSSEATLTRAPSQSLTTSSTIASDSLVTSSSSYSSVDDGVTSTLALLAGENIQVEGTLSQSQAATLTLSDLTSDPTLAEILGASHDPTAAGFSQATLDTPVSQLSYLSSLGHQLSELVGPTVGGGGGSASLVSNLATPPTAAAINFSDTESVGSGTRPLSYAKETDQALANWVKEQQAAGSKVTFASLRAHAKKIVSLENPSFNASVGWVTPFLLRHNLDLKINDRRSRSTRKTVNPRKLQSKGESHDELSNDEPIPMDEEGEMDLQPLPIISQLPSQLINSDEQNESVAIMEHNTSRQSDGSMVGVAENDATTPQVIEKTEQIEDLTPPTSKKVKVGNRSRHTLAEKLEVVRLMKEHNVAGHYVSKLLGIANSTLSGWIKLVDQKGSELVALSSNKKRSNRSGQGRPLTYSKEKDEIIAQWMKSQQEMGVSVSTQELTMYATKVIQEENSNFIASVGWRHKFLQRHNLQLVKADKSSTSSSQEDLQNIPLPVQTEEVCTDEYTPEAIEKEYPEEILLQLHDWTVQRVAEQGSLSLHVFCKKAEELILPTNPMFVATLGWVFKFLYKHSIMLDPRPTNVEVGRKRPLSSELTPDEGQLPTKKPLTPAAAIVAAAMGLSPEGLTVSPSTGNLCEALLSLSSQSEQIVCDTSLDGAAATSISSATTPTTDSTTPSTQLSSAKNYFGKPAREFSSEEKEEVVRYANAMTLQKAAIKYGVAAPTVWRWRMELKLHQPKYTANQKKYIVKFAETNSVKDAASRFGITTKTIQNWKKALQLDGTLSDVEIAAIPPPSLQEMGEPSDTLTTPSTSGGLISEEVIPLDNSHFQYIVDGGEVAEGSRVQPTITGVPSTSDSTDPSSLEVTHEVQVQDVGMEYDVISSEGHAAKPRCTQEEKAHILQYALDHSIKEASLKYGVSPGTLYYWKKNHGASKNKIVTGSPSSSNTSGGNTMTDSFTSTQHHSANLETTIVNVSVPVDIGSTSSIIQTSTPVTGTVDTTGLQSFAITDAAASVLGDGAVPTASLINAITQTLASATPEQLQSLQQITSDLNLLQAVTSLLSSQDGSSSLKNIIPIEGTHSRHDSTVSNGGISSPTEVLVSFHTTNDIPMTDTPAETAMTGTTNIPTDTTNTPTDTTNIPTDTTNIPTDTTNIPTDTTSISTGTTNIPTDTTNIPTGSTDIPIGTTDISTNSTATITGTSGTSTVVTDTPTTVTPIAAEGIAASNQTELQVQLEVSSEMPLAVEEVTTSQTATTPIDDQDDGVAMATDEDMVEKPQNTQIVTKTSEV